MHPMSRELATSMTNLNSHLNQHQISSLQELHGQPQMPTFDHTLSSSSSHEDFLEQFLSSSAPTFPWSDEPSSVLMQHMSNGAAAKSALMQQQLLLSRSLLGDHNDVVDGSSFKNLNNQGNDESFKALFNGFNGSIGQISNQTQQFNSPQGGAMPAMSQPAVSGSSGGTAGQPRQRVRARRGQATDPHSIAERLRRERIAERMKGLQELVPNANKTDKASMLDEIIDYVKFLQLQVKVLSMSRLGGAAAVAPLVADMSTEGRNSNGTQTASSSNNDDRMTVTENQVAKLMEEDMGSAMQYLQGKGLCLMPISLATAISTSMGPTRNPLNANGTTNNPLLNGDVGPTSPNMSGLTIQSTTVVKPPSKN